MTEGRQAELERRLRGNLEPGDLLIKDQSHLHAGHAGARDGRGHFAIRLTSTAFEGLSRIQRHRLVYDAVGDLMETDIHALSITALTPDEASRG